MTDVIAIAINALGKALGIPAYSEKPDSPPREYVTVRRNGGRGDRFTDRPRVTVHCWAKSDARAAQMAYAAADAMLALPDHVDNVAAVEQDSIYSNGIDDQRRWTASFNVVANR